MSDPANLQVLPAGYRLLWYEIEAVLGQGGFGITYRARDTNLEQTVAIKEYLPSLFAARNPDGAVVPLGEEQREDFDWGLSRFIDEGRTLARFDHPGIVRVLSVFEESGTAYLVMRYENGEPLDSLLKRENVIDEDRLKRILFDVMDGLTPVHDAGFIHRDIKPANIYLREDGSAVLIDFGSARQALGTQTKTLTTLVSPGYAPFEQYYSDGSQQGPWTDIYALGATAYRAMTGRAPLPAVDRSRELTTQQNDATGDALTAIEHYSPSFVQAIRTALEFREQDRPQNIVAWRSLFGVAPTPVVGASAVTEVINIAGDPPTEKTEVLTPAIDTEAATEIHAAPTANDSRRSHRRWYAAAGVIIMIVLVLFARGGRDANNRAPSTAVSAPKPAATSSSSPLTAATQNQPSPIESLLADAQNAFAAGRLVRPPGDNALEAYRAVLAEDPFNADAKAGIERIVERKLQQARSAADAKDVYLAKVHIEEAALADPAHPKVLAAQARLEEALRNQRATSQQTGPAKSTPAPAPAPRIREAIAERAAAVASDPKARKELEKARRALRNQDYEKVFKHLQKGLGNQ